jgi:hypothetical protein
MKLSHLGYAICTLLTSIGLAFFCSTLNAQTTAARVSGQIADPQGHVVQGARVIFTNINTGIPYSTETNGDGIYTLSTLQPGLYRANVTKDGFKGVVKSDIELHVQDQVSLNFALQVGSVNEVVTVQGGALLVNTENAAVSTVVDRNFAENLPLNGRSFQSLILLSPGVVSNTPQASGTTLGANGEFSVNGQRTESNYYTVDGVSANIGVNAVTPGAGSTGSVPAATALGTTQSLVSVDALEEFRVSSSTYSAEYGRNPGGQFSLVTRAGTNQWHGTAFDYLRNDAFDANNWFNDFFKKAEPPLRQNDFGGTFGGPVLRNKTFFFFSYEGLRLTQPQAASISYVPTAVLRQNAPLPLRQVLNAFPVANGPDQGNGLAQFIGTWSNPASLNAYSIRFDHDLNDKLKIFFRFSDTDSNATVRGVGAAGNPTAPSTLQKTDYTLRNYTVGASSAFFDHLVNELRFGYASNTSTINNSIDAFGNAQPVDLAQIVGVDRSAAYQLAPILAFGAFFTQLTQQSILGEQRQWNITDSVSYMVGQHQLKFGIDYRRLTPVQEPAAGIRYLFFNQGEVQANNAAEVVSFNFAKSYPLTTNFSAFTQDEWRVTQRLNISMGLRWEVNPATGAAQGPLPLTVQGINNLSTMKLAPVGTPLWNTTWYNFAPRLGAAYVLRGATNNETVVRGGGGVYFDTGQESGAYGFIGPNYQSLVLGGSLFGSAGSFPQAGAIPPVNQNPAPPYGTLEAFPAHLQLPYTIQWNVSVDQALGTAQAISLGYVGSHAGRLLEKSQLQVSKFNPNFTILQLFQNGSTADYDALQVQFRRRISRGLNTLASYTWGHSIDYGSTNLTFPYVRGNSDFDVRHTFSSAFAYDLPGQFHNRALRMLFQSWGLDDRLMARSGFPVSLLNGGGTPDPVTGQFLYSGLNLVPDQAFYIYGPQFPGGRSINPAAFHVPAAGQSGTAPRNFLRGFGAWQMDVAVRREFPVSEKMKLQFRAETFNVFNHPNFGFINPALGQPTFGQATSTLNNSPRILSSLYQMGGPRSMQFALKLAF